MTTNSIVLYFIKTWLRKQQLSIFSCIIIDAKNTAKIMMIRLAKYVNPGKISEEFDVTVEVFSGDDTLLQTWEYNKCERESYELYLDDSIVYYKFHEKWQSELKDRTIFECGGLEFKT